MAVKLAATLFDQRQPVTVDNDVMGADIPDILARADAIKRMGGHPVPAQIKRCGQIGFHTPPSLCPRIGKGAEINKIHVRHMRRVA